MNISIRPETNKDLDAIWRINQAAFGGEEEANLVNALRDGGFVDVSLAAEYEEKIIGHILFSRAAVMTNDGALDVLSLAPMAVAPSHQRRGIGSKLVIAGLSRCREQGHEIVVVLGHPNFYSRFGFSSELAEPLENPFGGGAAWMAMELAPEALTGVEGRVEYPPPFSALK